MSDYFYLDDNREPQGPHSLAELARLRDTGRITDTTLAALRGGSSWLPVGELLAGAPAEAPVPALPPHSAGAAADTFGPCPTCRVAVQPDAAGALPERCPACYRRLRVTGVGLWANFCAAFCQYVAFNGRATRKEFWSFIIISHIVICLFLLLLLWPMASIVSIVMEQLSQMDMEQLKQMSEAELEAYLRTELEPVLQTSLTGPVLLALLVGGLGLMLSSLVFLLPTIAVTMRRLHDIGWSGWWVGACIILDVLSPISVLISLASIAIALLILVLCFLDSQPGTNAYGPSAKYPRG